MLGKKKPTNIRTIKWTHPKSTLKKKKNRTKPQGGEGKKKKKLAKQPQSKHKVCLKSNTNKIKQNEFWVSKYQREDEGRGSAAMKHRQIAVTGMQEARCCWSLSKMVASAVGASWAWGNSREGRVGAVVAWRTPGERHWCGATLAEGNGHVQLAMWLGWTAVIVASSNKKITRSYCQQYNKKMLPTRQKWQDTISTKVKFNSWWCLIKLFRTFLSFHIELG